MKKLLFVLALLFCAQCVQLSEITHGTHKKHHKKHAKGLKKKKLVGIVKKSFRKTTVTIPNTLDLRPMLTQIEDQGQCGDCWSFSLTSVHRDGHKIDGRDPGRLSQEWLTDNSPESLGCNGGYFDSAQDLINGQPLWDACPYAEGTGNCPANLPVAAGIKSWGMMDPTPQDIEIYMTQTKKPVSITVAAGAGDWEDYTGGVYDSCVANAQVDHMIAIVGWNNEGAKFDSHGNLPPGKGQWILRNSWGTSWGENGWMTTKMTDLHGNKCNSVAEDVAYLVTK